VLAEQEGRRVREVGHVERVGWRRPATRGGCREKKRRRRAVALLDGESGARKVEGERRERERPRRRRTRHAGHRARCRQ